MTGTMSPATSILHLADLSVSHAVSMGVGVSAMVEGCRTKPRATIFCSVKPYAVELVNPTNSPFLNICNRDNCPSKRSKSIIIPVMKDRHIRYEDDWRKP